MNRSTLIFSALLLSGTMAERALAARASRPAVVASSASRGATSVRNTQAHSEAKCGRCGGTGGGSSAPRATKDVHASDGGKETFGREGRILHGREGSRESRWERHEHSPIGGRGYVQRSYSYHGHEFAHRTYYLHGVAYSRCYQPYRYRGIEFHVYAPGFYYAPAFYGWAYSPWAAPVAWEWGWARHPWYRYYGAWFRPYPVYTSPSLWLTDYLVAQTLEAAYEARIDAAAQRRAQAADLASSPMLPEVKQAISEEVRRQLALENAEARDSRQTPPDPGSSGLARMLGDGISHVFVVGTGLDVRSGVRECSLTEGDVIQLNGPTTPSSVTANLVVLATKGSDCPKGSSVTVGLADLQEMQNHMRATIDQGLSELHSKQGQNGFPALPPAATKPPVQSKFAAIAPPSDPNSEPDARQQPAEAGKDIRR